MDQNRIPSSSPMQHHDACGRPTSSSNPSDPIAPSSTMPRPSSSQQSPPGQTSNHPWPLEKHGESSGSSTWASSSASWQSKDDEATVNPSSIASSSRLPSTHFLTEGDTDETMSSSPITPTEDIYLETPGSALLTSEPLNRSASTAPSPALSIPSTAPSPLPVPTSGRLATGSSASSRVGKRRLRASSLPYTITSHKRRRVAGDAPTPTEESARIFAQRLRDPQRLSVQQARARELGARLLAGRPLKGGCRPGEQIVVASHHPPINIKTLRSLDAHEILKQPQLRHDLLFDTLAFRPINASSAATYSETLTTGTELAATAEPASSSGAVAAVARGACTVTDMYWESVEMEITTGCRCTRWQVPVGQQVDVKSIKGKERMMECVCGKWRSDLNEDEWWSFQQSRMWKSRLPELIKTLREILISLMGSTTPCPNHFAHSFSREALDLHELTCPTVTHALVPQLYEALDPEFLTRRVRRQTFDFSLFEMLGEAMKVHCAPIRDGLVDEMVRTATGSGVAMGLRKCFDCVEIMKLDIANHQVHALRPYLWSCATQYELSAFHAFLASSSILLPSSSTRAWVRASSLRVVARASPAERTHLVGNCPCRLGDNTELVLRSAADGFTALIFGDQGWKMGEGKAGGRWQAFLNPKNGMAVEACSADSVPESLRMDVRRISAFHAEAVEMTIVHLLILACRDILPSIHPSLSPKASRKHLEDISNDLDLILSNHPVCGGEQDGEVALQLAARILRLEPSDLTSFPYTSAEHIQLERLADQLSKYITTHIRPDSTLFAHSFKRIEEVVRVMLTHEMLKLEGEMTVAQASAGGAGVAGIEACKAMRGIKSYSADSDDEDDSVPAAAGVAEGGPEKERTDSTAVRRQSRAVRERQRAEEKRLARLYGLEPVYGDMRALVKRMERIAGFNVRVFRQIYGEAGMVVGA